MSSKTSHEPEPSAAIENRRAQLYKGVAEMALLAVLRARPQYGLELLEALNAAGLEIADGTIYPLLHRLERAALVAADWRTETPNGRPRKYYKLTAAGRRELDAMRAEWRSLAGQIESLLEGGAR